MSDKTLSSKTSFDVKFKDFDIFSDISITSFFESEETITILALAATFLRIGSKIFGSRN